MNYVADFERALLGALMLEPDSWGRIADLVSAVDFYRADHRLIFEAITELATHDEPPDAVTVGDQLNRQGELDAAGGRDYIAQLFENTTSATNIRAYARRVREHATARRAKEVALKIARDVDEGRNIAELVNDAQAKLTRLGIEAKPRVEPLCDPADCGVGDFLDRAPVARTWILEDLLPLGIVGLLAAGGGTGKSFLMLQLAVSIATGRPFLGIEVAAAGAVLLLCAEDERDELHRRLWRIIQLMREGGEFTDVDAELVIERLHIKSRVGEDNLLTQAVGGIVVRTDMGERIALLGEQIPALKLIVLDPVSRFRGGNENSNDDATRYAEAVETLRAATGATILMPHHMSKAGLMAGADRLSAEGLRGASALLDAVRWAAAMGTLRKDAAADYGIDPEDASCYVRLDTVKNNYGPPWEGLWLRRDRGGVLVPIDMPTKRKRNQEAKGEERYRETLPKLKGLVEQEQEKTTPLTRTRLRDYAGTAGIFGMSDKTLRSVLERAITEGQIKVRANGRSEELRV